MDIRIRSAPPPRADIDGHSRHRQRLRRAEPDAAAHRPSRSAACCPASWSPSSRGRIVGCGSNVPLTPQLTELRSLAVAPEYRGTGLGRRLVEALVDQARDDGLRPDLRADAERGLLQRVRLRHRRPLGHLAEDLARVHLLPEVRRVRRDRRADEPDASRSRAEADRARAVSWQLSAGSCALRR